MDMMGWFVSTILIGVLVFVATNIDDLFLLIFLFSQNNLRKQQIVVGQYLGFIIIIGVSSLGFFSKWIIPLPLIGFLGLVPIALGIKEIKKLFGKQDLADKAFYLPPDTSPFLVRMIFRPLLSLQTYSVAAMTVGDGPDNIATYIPLFAAGNLTRMGILIGLFLLLLGLWCSIGYILANLPATVYKMISSRLSNRTRQVGVKASLDRTSGLLYHLPDKMRDGIKRYGPGSLLAFIFIILGILIMRETGTFSFLISQFTRLR